MSKIEDIQIIYNSHLDYYFLVASEFLEYRIFSKDIYKDYADALEAKKEIIYKAKFYNFRNSKKRKAEFFVNEFCDLFKNNNRRSKCHV